MSTLEELGITREHVLDVVADKVISMLDEVDDGWLDTIRDRIEKAITKPAHERITALLDAELAKIADMEFGPVDNWGEPVRGSTKTTLRELLKAKAMGYLRQGVDRHGKPTEAYNATETRADYVAREAANKAMEGEIRAELNKAVEQCKAQLRKQVADYITQTLLASK